MTVAEARSAVMQDPATSVEAGLAHIPQPGDQISSTVIELFPRIDPMDLTRDGFLELSDGSPRFDTLIELRRDPYDTSRIEQAARLFPEGYEFPLSEIERIVFNAMSRIMSAEDGSVFAADAKTLSDYIHVGSVEEAIEALHQEGANRREGHFWPTREIIGGYNLNRLIASEVRNKAELENALDEAKLTSLQDMSSSLSGRGYAMRESDQAEMERLRAEHEKREKNKQVHLDRQRIAAYKH